MTELITITEQNGQRAVSARELHQFLESKQQFANWIQNRIKDYGFVEGQYFEVFNNFIKNPDGGRPTTEYAISIDMAKELSMVGPISKSAHFIAGISFNSSINVMYNCFIGISRLNFF